MDEECKFVKNKATIQMKIFRSEQTRIIDEFTILHEPVASIDLMERASKQLFGWITKKFERSDHFVFFIGPGNNGGDGLALARMLVKDRYDVEVHYVKFTENTSSDWKINKKRIEDETNVKVNDITDPGMFPIISRGDVIVDAIFGSGLSRPATGLVKDVIGYINCSDAIRVSVDIPSGLFGEDNSKNSFDGVVKADYTLSFQFPKLSFMFAENAQYTGEWVILPIGLSKDAIDRTDSPYNFLEGTDMIPFLKKRNKFDHKGIFGHGLLIAGSFGKMGAAFFGAGAALRTGIGLITCHIPAVGVPVLQSSLPEAMAIADKSAGFVSDIGSTDAFSAIGIGPGLGKNVETQNALHNLLSGCKKPLVIDADGLNILSLNRDWYSMIPEGCILTPHPKEFERLAGKSENSFTRLNKQIGFSAKHKCIVVLKGANTSVTTPDGRVFFNSTGNPGMATGGSGDVLTGIILSLLAQGYTPEKAAVLGVFLHGLAGDIAAEKGCYESIIASDIINNIGKAFNKIREYIL